MRLGIFLKGLLLFGFALLGFGWLFKEPETSREEIFRRVWDTVDNDFYDASFGGISWEDVGQRYEPLVLSAPSKDQFWNLLNQMVWELNVSHSGVSSLENVINIGSPYLFLHGDPGIDIRLLEEGTIVTSVMPGSAAERQGLVMGCRILEIDGTAIEDILARAVEAPPGTIATAHYYQTEAVLRQLYGSPGSSVNIVFQDSEDNKRQAVIDRIRRKGAFSLFPGFPQIILDHQIATFPDGVRYIRFSAFQPHTPTLVIDALQASVNAPGMIIDLRGNNGGSMDAFRQLVGRLIKEDTYVGGFQTRYHYQKMVVEPWSHAYLGPLVILLDELSISAAEIFAAALAETGRATLIGKPSVGMVLAGDLSPLPGDGAIVCPVAIWKTARGEVLEARGVTPHLEVPLTRERLLMGIDEQLQAAIDYLSEVRESE